MAEPALQLEHVSKLYRLGQVGTGTLAHDLNRLAARLMGREDPFSKVGAVNDREQVGGDYVWALRDISFEVGQGEIVGIIGRNGAGKSTLLKLLSRVTAPTEGQIRINGRIASLLEVGTGFHPDLTGRENIYLNGAILGMSRREISARFDEIVEFSGCAKYIDTPVKRYSSGMYVRLAFAVAAHLETDILIVDEVLAVGDADFQRRCIGKMQDISRELHRTVLFVSHNMASVKQLCPSSILMERGLVAVAGATDDIIERYMRRGQQADRILTWPHNEAPCSSDLLLSNIRVMNDHGAVDCAITSSDGIQISIEYEALSDIRDLRIAMIVTSQDGVDVFCSSDYHSQPAGKIRKKGCYHSTCRIPAGLLNVGRYFLQFDFEIPFERLVLPPQMVSFEVSELAHNQLGPIRASKPRGVIYPILDWIVERKVAESPNTELFGAGRIVGRT